MRPFLRSMALAALLVAAAPVRADELSDLAGQVRAESELVERMAASHGQSLSRYEQLAASIQRAKRAGSLNPVAAATLQADLRFAHEQAVALQRSNAALTAAQERLDAITDQYRESLLARIETLQFELRHRSRASDTEAEIRRLTAALQGLAAPLPPMSASPVAAILEVEAPTPEQLQAASLELRDHSARLERQLSEVRSRIASEEQQGRLQARLRAMASSDALFEDGFGAGGRSGRAPSAVMERGSDSSVAASEVAAPAFGGMSDAAAGASIPTGPMTSAPGGAGGRVAVGTTGQTGPLAASSVIPAAPSRALVELRSREAQLLRSLDEARAAQQRLAQASAELREAEERER